jgi:hypothetical protein
VITIEDDDGYELLTGVTKAIWGDVVDDRNGVEGQLGHETMARSCHKVYTQRDLDGFLQHLQWRVRAGRSMSKALGTSSLAICRFVLKTDAA